MAIELADKVWLTVDKYNFIVTAEMPIVSGRGRKKKDDKPQADFTLITRYFPNLRIASRFVIELLVKRDKQMYLTHKKDMSIEDFRDKLKEKAKPLSVLMKRLERFKKEVVSNVSRITHSDLVKEYQDSVDKKSRTKKD